MSPRLADRPPTLLLIMFWPVAASRTKISTTALVLRHTFSESEQNGAFISSVTLLTAFHRIPVCSSSTCIRLLSLAVGNVSSIWTPGSRVEWAGACI